MQINVGTWLGNGKDLSGFRFFLWLVIHESLLANSLRMKCHLRNNPVCPRCQFQEEIGFYILHDCIKVNELWHRVVPQERWETFLTANLHDYMLHDHRRCESCNFVISWDVVFGTEIWLLWQWGNKGVFGEGWINKEDIYLGLIQKAKDFQESIQMESSAQANRSLVLKQVGRSNPEDGWCRINTDGAVSAVDHKVASGGVIRDHVSVWLGGFM